ncbi:hypothetical protein ACTHOQ_13435 [Solibacillus silvestris]|uniref:hypothetical protein n=1 Tax=Solibacillus silvestris TaxID=76853 RepID=UPI003F823F25
MKKIQFIKDGYEIVVAIPESGRHEDSEFIEADAYYKDFDEYRILVLANSEEKAVEMATKELLTNHPFEQIAKDY